MEDVNTLDIPRDADLIKVDRQCNNICLWFIVDTDNSTEERDFIVYGTGQEIKKDLSELFYLNTVMFNNNSMVLHVFELIQ